MYDFSPRYNFLLTMASVVCFAAAVQCQAQVMLVSTPSASQPSSTSATNSASMRNFTPARLINAQVRDGILTIDGMVAKVQLNYEIQRDGYMYFFVPGTGTAIVSLSPMPGAERVQDAFNGSRLSFVAGGHSFELSADGNLLNRDKGRTDVYVRFDTTALALSRYPRMGFGNTLEAPYAWPLSARPPRDKYAHYVTPLPMPRSVLPETVTAELPTARTSVAAQ